MAAVGHSYRTEVQSKSFGNSTGASPHLDSMLPGTLEEEEWLDNELERARMQRGGYYKKLVNSRAASARELEDLAASRLRSTSRGSTERELSGSPSLSTCSPSPSIPEPHSSWRFYTSYDNGEWKRHCVPVYKPEEEILRKSPSSDILDRDRSPAYESHLKKYRQARASLFDRPSRRFTSSTSPVNTQGDTTTLRIVSHGNTGALRTGLTASGMPMPFGGSSTDVFTVNGRHQDVGKSTPLPTHYHEHTTTSETVTTVEEPEPRHHVKHQHAHQQATTGIESRRPKHNNLGYKEKVIVPTKYKTESEIEEMNKPGNEGMAIPRPFEALKEKTIPVPEKKKVTIKQEPDELTYLGSTFEKFNYTGVPMLKPMKHDETNGSETVTKVRVENVKRKPVFDNMPFPPQPKPVFDNMPFPSQPKPVFDNMPFPSQPLKQGVSFKHSETSSAFSDPRPPVSFNDPRPVSFSSNHRDTEDRRSLPFGPPGVESSRNTLMHENSVQSESDHFDVPIIKTVNRNISVESPSGSNKERNGSELTTAESFKVSKFSDQSANKSEKSDGIIFIPVIRVMGSNPSERHVSQLKMDVNMGQGRDSSGLRNDGILELDELVGLEDDNFDSIKINKAITDGMAEGIKNIQIETSAFQQPEIKSSESIQWNSASTNKIKPTFSDKNEVMQTKQSPAVSSSERNVSSRSGEKIIIPSIYKDRYKENNSENKNTDSGPSPFSAATRDTPPNIEDLNMIRQISVGLPHENVTSKQSSFWKPLDDNNSTNSVSISVSERRSEKPVFPNSPKFCSTVELTATPRIEFNPFDETKDRSNEMQVSYEVRRTSGGSNTTRAQPLIRTQQAEYSINSPDVTTLRGASTADQIPSGADDEWVVESARPRN